MAVAALRRRLALHERWRKVRRAAEKAFERARGKTSVSDRLTYTKLCRRAARDPEVFATFKRHASYTPILEHVTCEQGSEYLRIVLEHSPSFVSLLERFRENDRFGEPTTCSYGEHGDFSPTTLRYVKVVSDLSRLFGSPDRLRIIEIGCGYGGQCFVTSTVLSPEEYVLVDLDACLRLQRTYLAKLGVRKTRFLKPDDIPPDGTYDLVVSNYAFTEVVRKAADMYLERVLQRSARGYVTCNWISPPEFQSLSPDELLAAIPGSRFISEEPLTAPDNRIWVWGDG